MTIVSIEETRMIFTKFIERLGWEIGEHTYGRPIVRFYDSGMPLKIGKYCSIADNVTIMLGGNHRTDWISTYPFPVIDTWPEAHSIEGFPATNGGVTIGNDVWIGSQVFILSGVTIGDGAVLGACSVITKDVAPYAIVAGNPAVGVRKRFSDEKITQLLEERWWDWPEEKVRAEMGCLCS